MAAHTASASFSDTTYAISASLPATYDSSGYGATTITYTTIGSVEAFPAFGSQRQVFNFEPINGNVEYHKGTESYGGGEMVMADIPADTGQVIVKAAEASKNHYSMKITYPDGEIHYLDVIVTSWVLSGQGSNQIMKRSANVQLCRAPVIVAAV